MYRFFKRLFDILFSLLGIILLLPLLLTVAILIKLSSKGPILFKQERLGKNGKIFKVWKFRTMIVGAEKQGVYETKIDDRVTGIGRILRKTSMDELPQFINILKGDMSIIGPRPALTYHPWPYKQYTDFQKRRMLVRPGVTGWAQVNGRKDVEWNKRIELDVYYVENLSMWFDIRIFIKTIWKVLLMKDNLNKKETANVSNNLTLMYITNNPAIAIIAEKAGVDWIFVDLEIKGKIERQGHLNTVISKHSISDIKSIKDVLKKSKLLVRVNPINKESEEEINQVIKHGAEIVMLPFFKNANEVKTFISLINNRAETCLLLETPEAVEDLDDILKITGIDYIHIGLNDLHLGYKMKFMFELLADGTVEKIIDKIKKTNIKYGFGGIAQIGQGDLPAEKIIVEHYRLGSTMTILSRRFYDSKRVKDLKEIKDVFDEGVNIIRNFETTLANKDTYYFYDNQKEVIEIVNNIVKKID